MNRYDILLIFLLLLSVYVAFRSWQRRKKDCANQDSCSNCPRNMACRQKPFAKERKE